jgi:SAM-dependent methyltransferase
MPLSIRYSDPAEAVHYYADGAVKSDSWTAVPLVKKNDLYDAIKAKLPANTPAKVLEIGCGSGGLALRLAQGNQMPNLTYVGIDVSPKSITTAKGQGLDPAKYSFEVQNAYEYLTQTPCDWDFLVSSMFLFGHDPESLHTLLRPMLDYARKGYIIAAGAEAKPTLLQFTSDVVDVAGQDNTTNMVVATKVFPQVRTKFSPMSLPLRARMVETGALNYAVADLAFKNTGNWPASIQGVTTQKVAAKKSGALVAPSLAPLNVVQRVKV